MPKQFVGGVGSCLAPLSVDSPSDNPNGSVAQLDRAADF